MLGRLTLVRLTSVRLRLVARSAWQRKVEHIGDTKWNFSNLQSCPGREGYFHRGRPLRGATHEALRCWRRRLRNTATINSSASQSESCDGQEPLPMPTSKNENRPADPDQPKTECSAPDIYSFFFK